MNAFSRLSMAVALIAVLPALAQAETIYALRNDNTLLRMNSRTPGTIDATVPVTGLAVGQTLRGIDFRPATGELYGLGVNTTTNADVQLYKINITTGAAAAVGAAFAVTPAAGAWGLDFNPTVDRVRVINASRANFRINPNTGDLVDGNSGTAGIQQDTVLAGADTFTDLAYDRSFDGCTTTTLYAIDYTTNSLVTIGGLNGSPSPNLGAINNVGPLGVNLQNVTGAFDISGPNLYLISQVTAVTNLYTVNKATGAATLVGAVGGNPTIISMAVQASIKLISFTDNAGFEGASIVEGERDYYAVNVPANSRIWAIADAGGPRNDATASRDVSLRLFNTDFLTLIEEDRGDTANTGEDDTQEGSGAGIIAGRSVTTAGQYFLEVSEGFLVASNDDDPIANFKITVAVTTEAGTAETENNDTVGNANPIGTASGILIRSATSSTTDVDWFRIDLTAGDVVMVMANGNPTLGLPATELGIDSLRLRAPSPYQDNLLQSVFNRNTGTQPNEIGAGFLFYVYKSGTYYVTVEGDKSEDYLLLVKTVRKVVTVAETPVSAIGQELPGVSTGPVIVGGSISVAGEKDLYKFNASAGSRVWAYLDTGGPLNQTALVSRDSVLTLIDVNGTSELENDDNDGTGNGNDDTDGQNAISSLIAGRILNTTGTYTLRVEEKGNDQPIDPYRLIVFVSTQADVQEAEPNNTPATAMQAATGTTGIFNGNISTVGDVDYYYIDAKAEDILYIAADGDLDRNQDGTDLTLRLFAPNGTTNLINPAGGIDASGESPIPGEGFSFRIIEGGRYYLSVAQRTNTKTGTYRLMMTRTGNGSTDLGITLASSANVVNVNTPIEFTVTVTNNGPVAATNVRVVGPALTNATFTLSTAEVDLTLSTVSGIVASCPTLASGASRVFKITATPTLADVTVSLAASAQESDYIGANNSVTRRLTDNAPPVIASAPVATPNPTLEMQVTIFSVSATDPEGGALTYSWDFGDGTPATTGATPTHTYTVPGTYNVVVSVTDPAGNVTTGSILLVVRDQGISGGLDSDGDGFSDEIETLAGTNPNSSSSTPFGGASVEVAGLLTVSKLQIKLNFAKANSDSISLSGTLPIPDGVGPANQQAIIDIGGVIRVINLDAKGKAPKSDTTFKASIKGKKGVFRAQNAKFTAGVKKAGLVSLFADEQLTGDMDVKNAIRNVLCTVFFGGGVFQKQQPQIYSAKAGKTGSTKLPR